MEALTYLTYLGVLILIGLIITYFSDRMKIPNIFLLIVSGMLINFIVIKYAQVTHTTKIEFPVVFIASLSILALVMIIFESTSKFKYKEFDDFSVYALKYSIIFLITNLIFFSAIVYLFLDANNIFLAMVFAALMSGTSPDAVLYMLKDRTHKVLQFLKIESIINTPLIVLFPFIILNIMEKMEGEFVFTNIASQIIPFLQQIASGIGAGLLIGLIILKLLRKIYSQTLGPLIIIASALLAFILAENIGGNGVLAVTTLGLMFGNVYVKQKEQLQEFSRIFSNFLEITVFILIGVLIELPMNGLFYLKSISLFIIYLGIRYITINFTFKKETFKLREKVFMTLSASKGISVAVVVALLLNITLKLKGKETLFVNIPGGQEILNYALAFILYSIIISTIAIKLSKYFIKRKVVVEEQIEIIKDKKNNVKKKGKREVKRIRKMKKLRKEIKVLKDKKKR
tara:strand:+ start:22638 stop:24008 length:1371 start_codon:yes stop_codon:yes gene_type:complete